MNELNGLRDRLLGDDAYGLLVRVAGVVLAVALWYVSMRFSVSGFQIASQENAWVGWVLGATVTYLQIIFNRGTRNKTIYMAGILAYIYGMATNLVGIMALRDTSFTMEFLQATPLAFFLQLTIVVGLALTVEILPEHLFILGIRDSDADDSDFVDSLSGIRDVFANRNPRQRRVTTSRNQNQPKKSGQQKGSQGQGHRTDKRQEQYPPRNNQGNGREQPQHQPQPPSRSSEVYYPVSERE